MANFPIGIRCSSITPTPGTFPGIDHIMIAGNIRSYQGGNRITNGTITLSFNSISTATVAALRAHWDSEQTYGSWQLSSELLDGLEYATEYSSRTWQYNGPYRITDYTSESGGVHDAAVDLRQVPAFEFIDPLIIRPQTAYLRLGSVIRLVGPGDLPDLWTSRLTTEQRGSIVNGGSFGSITPGPDGTSFQAFWFEPTTGTFPNQKIRLVVVKRDVQGVILWQVWTSAEWGDQFTSRDAFAPQVLPLSDGGCVVFAADTNQLNNTSTIITTRGWRISSAGSQLWTKEYAGNVSGAFRVALSGSQIVVYTNTRLAGVPFTPAAPALLFINLSDGAFIGGYAYRVNNTSEALGATYKDNLFVLPSGSITLKAAQTVFIEVSSNGATVNRVATFSAGTSCLDGYATLLPGGQYLCRNDSFMLVRLAADFSIFASYKYTNAMSAGGAFFGDLWGNAIAADSLGNGYNIGRQSATGIKIVKFASGGAGITDYEEISFGSNIGVELAGTATHGIDLEKNRGVFHLSGGASSVCRVTAIGFSLNQTTEGASLNTGTCDNTMNVRGYSPVTYTTATPDTITRTTGSATVATVTLTVSNGILNMVDSSSSLSWIRRALIV